MFAQSTNNQGSTYLPGDPSLLHVSKRFFEDKYDAPSLSSLSPLGEGEWLGVGTVPRRQQGNMEDLFSLSRPLFISPGRSIRPVNTAPWV